MPKSLYSNKLPSQSSNVVGITLAQINSHLSHQMDLEATITWLLQGWGGEGAAVHVDMAVTTAKGQLL